MNTEKIKDKIQSNQFRKVIICVLFGVAALILFGLGMQVGYMKAAFSYNSGDNYYRSFGPASHQPMGIGQNGVSDAHGVSGSIVSISLPTFVVADKDNTEKTVYTEDSTMIRELRNTITAADLKTGDYVVVIGEPNDTAQVDAKFIRVIPPSPPPQGASAAPSTGVTPATN